LPGAIAGLPRTPSGGTTMLLAANRKISPSGVSPWRYSIPDPSSQSTMPPRGLTAMLSGLLRMSEAGEAYSTRMAPVAGSYSKIWPWPIGPPLVETM
jgi:hypothetical protein